MLSRVERCRTTLSIRERKKDFFCGCEIILAWFQSCGRFFPISIKAAFNSSDISRIGIFVVCRSSNDSSSCFNSRRAFSHLFSSSEATKRLSGSI
jgi:hypothetical protein